MRLALGAATLCLLVLPGCGHSVPQPVQQITSSDGHLTALIGLDEGSAVIGGDWYFVEIDQAHPAWYQFLPRMRGAGVCSLQGRGAIRIRWSGPRELTVTCSDCDRSRFYIDKREWKGATIKYSFPSERKPQQDQK